MKTPNKYVTIVFTLAVLFALYELVLSPAGKRPVSKPDEAIKAASGDPSYRKDTLPEIKTDRRQEAAPGSQAIESRSYASKARQEAGKTLRWGRDPFLFPKGIEPYSKVEKAEKAKVLLPLKVNAVLISGRQKVATIDRAPYVVSIGDWIENEQVLEIELDRVVLGKGSKRRVLLLESLEFAPGKIQRIK